MTYAGQFLPLMFYFTFLTMNISDAQFDEDVEDQVEDALMGLDLAGMAE